MTASGALRAIDCPNCGAGLDVLGGGRVTTQVCGYCGASLDASEGFRVLDVFAGMARPASPFRLGMEGDVDGVRFTVIGTLGQVEEWAGGRAEWVDHMLYSPTHGYLWLTVEDGHVLLTRKVRDAPEFLSSAEVERSGERPARLWRGRRYRYYATSHWRTDYVEGAFNFRPARGDRGTTVSLMPFGAASDMLSFVDGAHGRGEREVEVTRHAPELAAAFGAEAPEPEGVHPLQPHRGGSRFWPAWFGGLAAASLVAMIALAAAQPAGETLVDGTVDATPTVVPFVVAEAGRPAKLLIDTDVANRWAALDISVTGPDGADVFDVGREISYYFGGSGEDRWSEGSRTGSVGFVPEAAGPHRLAVALAEGQRTSEPVRIRLREGEVAARWLVIAALGFTALWAWFASAAPRHRSRRWAGGDWTEEDDD